MLLIILLLIYDSLMMFLMGYKVREIQEPLKERKQLRAGMDILEEY